MWFCNSILQMHALLICDINSHRKTKSAINYEKIGCRDHLHSLRMLNSINPTPVPRLLLQGDRRFKAVSEANQTVSPHNCIDRISAEFGWQERWALTGSVKEPWRLLEWDPMLSHRVLAEWESRRERLVSSLFNFILPRESHLKENWLTSLYTIA